MIEFEPSFVTKDFIPEQIANVPPIAAPHQMAPCNRPQDQFSRFTVGKFQTFQRFKNLLPFRRFLPSLRSLERLRARAASLRWSAIYPNVIFTVGSLKPFKGFKNLLLLHLPSRHLRSIRQYCSTVSSSWLPAEPPVARMVGICSAAYSPVLYPASMRLRSKSKLTSAPGFPPFGWLGWPRAR